MAVEAAEVKRFSVGPAAMAGQIGVGGVAPIDYDRLAEAVGARQAVMTLNGRAFARLQSANTARAQNSRARSMALGVGK